MAECLHERRDRMNQQAADIPHCLASLDGAEGKSGRGGDCQRTGHCQIADGSRQGTARLKNAFIGAKFVKLLNENFHAKS